MSDGMLLKDLNERTRPCFVKEEGKFVFRIILTQGLNRQIRRMCKTLGYGVLSIKRVRVANILLGKLNPGDIRAVTGAELKELYYEVGKMPAVRRVLHGKRNGSLLRKRSSVRYGDVGGKGACVECRNAAQRAESGSPKCRWLRKNG